MKIYKGTLNFMKVNELYITLFSLMQEGQNHINFIQIMIQR